MSAALYAPGEQLACLMTGCDRCGAALGEQRPGGRPCGARRLLAVEHGHLDEGTGAWVTRGHQPMVRDPS